MKKAYGTGRPRPAGRPPEEAEDGELLAIKVLGFLAAHPERLDRFLRLSGLTAASLRQAAAAPTFTCAILDYVMGDEVLLLAFSLEEGLAPERVARASEDAHRMAGAGRSSE